MLIGTDTGSIRRSVRASSTRWRRDSPMPIMPPEHISSPSLRAASMVASFCSRVWVEHNVGKYDGACFQIAVIARHSGLAQTPHLLTSEQSHRSAQFLSALAVESLYMSAGFLKLLPAHGSTARDERETPYAMVAAAAACLHATLTVNQRIHVGAGRIMSRLRAPFAILRASSAPGIDYRTRVELTPYESRSHLFGRASITTVTPRQLYRKVREPPHR